MRRHSVRPQPIQKPDLVDEKVDVDGCADAGEEGNDEEGQRAGVAEEAGPLVRGGDLRQLLPAEVALDAPLAERPRALVADQKLTALEWMMREVKI